jgi:hypothetical protein
MSNVLEGHRHGAFVPPSMREECPSHSCGLTTRAIETKAAAASAWQSPRDIARLHGGHITLGDSPQGEIWAAVPLPV